jgi:hypothetical protein
MKVNSIVALRRTRVRHPINVGSVWGSPCHQNLETVIVSVYLCLYTKYDLWVQVVVNSVEVLKLLKSSGPENSLAYFLVPNILVALLYAINDLKDAW